MYMSRSPEIRSYSMFIQIVQVEYISMMMLFSLLDQSLKYCISYKEVQGNNQIIAVL